MSSVNRPSRIPQSPSAHCTLIAHMVRFLAKRNGDILNSSNIPYLAALLALSLHGATFTTGVSCTGTPSTQGGGPGVASASCIAYQAFNGDPQAFYSTAQASVFTSASLVSVSATADTFHLASSAFASYSTVVAITVTGGTGMGYLVPLNFVGDPGNPFHPGNVGGSFGVAAPSGAPCYSFVPPNGPPLPGCTTFTFGQTNLYPLTLSVGAGAPATAFAHFGDGFQFWDAQGNVLTNVQYTLTGLALPEPASLSLVLLGLLTLAALSLKRLP